MRTLRSAFTLIELLLYIGLSSIVIVAMLNFVVTLTQTRGEEKNRIILQQQLRLAAERITVTAHHADQMNIASSVFDTASGVLTLTMSGSTNPIVFSLSGGSIYGREGTASGRITTDDITIETLRFTNLTESGTYGTVQFAIQGHSNDPRWPDSMELRSAVSLRQ